METISGYLVILWLLPTMLFIVLPLASLIIWLGINAFKRLSKAILPSTTSADAETGRAEREKREDSRFMVKNIKADISDGLGSCSALVDNISRVGLCLKNVPESLTASNALLSVVVRNQSENFRLVARPKWEHWHPSGVKTIGAEIASHPKNWNDFVLAAG